MEQEFNDMKEVFKILPTSTEGNEFMIVIGKHLATPEKFESREDAQYVIDSTNWNLVAALIYACKEADEHEKKLERTAKKFKKNTKKED